MKIAYIKTNAESSGYVVHGLGILSSIGKRAGHESIWANPVMTASIPIDIDVVAITACSDAFPIAQGIAQFYKEHYPEVQIWAGGPHATFVPEDFNGPEFDHVVIGEGEVIWDRFCNGEVFTEKFIRGESPANLDDLPFVDRVQENDFLNGTEYPPRPLRAFPGPHKCVLAGRGCKYNCAFCKPGTFTMFGKRSRRRSVDNVMLELSQAGEIGSLFIHDDCLLEDGPWCTEFASKWSGKPFLIQARADLIVKQEKLLGYLVERGLCSMLIGFESGSDKVLKAMRKGTTRAINIKAAEICHRLGIVIQANMIFGVPGETQTDVEATFDLIKNHLQPCIISPAVYTPYPGSDWGRLCNEKGWNLVKDTYDYNRSAASGNKLKEEAFGYTYDWLYGRLHAEAIL